MATYTTLEEIKVSIQTDLFGDDRIELRPEQRDAIDFAKEKFCKKSGRKPDYEYSVLPEYRQFLWNAKMRFGKTICALQLAREMDVKRTLIITHRPVVGDSWFKAFRQVFGTDIKGNCNVRNKYGFGARSDMEEVGNFYDLEKFVETEGNHYIFFVSMQYIRLSELVNAKTQAKNQDRQDEDFWGHSTTKENEKLKADILNTDWDLVVIDEAHEGTRTALGKRVIDEFLKKDKTKMLHLSGTPFNLYEDFEKEEIYTWDYISEQQAKLRWEKEHHGEKNPYAELPRLNIYTYDITKNIDQVLDQTGIFTFTEFFRTWTGNPKADRAIMPEGAKGRFVHEQDVKRFLNLLCTKDATNNFPFSTDEYRGMFRHTLWVVSHVDEAKALSQLLHEHNIFKRFKIINVAGNGDSDEQRENALDAVNNAIGDLPEKTSTITISCGRLTTGVTVAPWSAVFYLKGGDRAATYMQTIFRVQSPYKTSDGKMKTSCYVFDFAPDRTLKIVAETAKFSSMAKAKEAKENETEEEKTQEMRDKDTVKDFIALCPVISMEGGQMSPLDVKDIYKQLENVFIDRLVRKGFDDPCLYVQDELNKVNSEIINHIGENGGKAYDDTRQEAKEVVDLSHMTPEQRAAWEAMIAKKRAEAEAKAAKKAKKDKEFKDWWENASIEEREKWLHEEQERAALRAKAKEERDEFRNRITNIRGIALRIPLLMYGGADAGDTQEDITVDNFTRKIKDESWAEFMPKGISKEDFNKIRKCFNATRFEEAGKKYRALTREADFLHVEERIKQITEIFSYFRNPDKETVLTPWRVVNMHLSETLGGWCFYDETFDEKNGMLDLPRYVDQGDLSKDLFDNVDVCGEVQTKILEINSKTGLYPLYITYSLYRRRLKEYIDAECIDISTISVQEEQVVWDDIVKDNIYVICNTPMAVGITRRTLFGFRGVEKKANIKNIKLKERVINDQENLVSELTKTGFWKGTTSKDMIKFNAVIGNPPYMETTNVNNRQNPIYHYFYDIAGALSSVYTLISPARFLFNAGLTPSEWNKKMLKDEHLQVVYYSSDSTTCFPNTAINGGVAIVLRNESVKNPPINLFLPDENLRSIASRFNPAGSNSLKNIVYGGRSDLKFNNAFLEAYPNSPQDRLSFIQKKRPAVKRLGPNEEYELKTSTIEALPYAFKDYVNNPDDYYHILGLVDSKRVWKYSMRKYLSPRYPNNNNIEKYKVIISESDGAAGQVGNPVPARLIGKPEIGKPGDTATSTFISVGAFNTEEEAINCSKYMRTKFLRCLVGILKVTQHNPPSVWAYVPIQDFTSQSDINWNMSISDIDIQLYDKYHFDVFEREFVEKFIAPLE